MKARHGIIILQPYADSISNGIKIREYRDYDIPKDYLNTPLYLLSKNFILGIIKFTHTEKLDSGSYCWHIQLLEKTYPPIKIKGKNGCQVWMRDVDTMQMQLQ